LIMIKKIDHIGIMVRDIDAALEGFLALGLTVSDRMIAKEFNCEIAFLPCGEVMLELVKPLGPGNGMNFLLERGEGLHHICFEVDDLQQAHSEYGKSLSVREDGIKTGAEGNDVFFIKADSLSGVLSEFTQKDTGEQQNRG